MTERRAAALRCVDRRPLRRPVHVDAGADHQGPVGGRLGQDTGELEVADHEVVRPLELDVNPGRGHRPLDQRQGHGGDGEVAAGGGKFLLAGAEQDREEQRLPRRRLPPAVEPAPAGGLVVGHDDEAGRGAGPRPFEQDGVGRRRLGQLDDVREPARPEPAELPVVEDRAGAGRVDVHDPSLADCPQVPAKSTTPVP